MVCKKLVNNVCTVASELAETDATPTPEQCRFCSEAAIPKQNINVVTISLAIAKANVLKKNELIEEYKRSLSQTGILHDLKNDLKRTHTESLHETCTYNHDNLCTILERLTNESTTSFVTNDDCKNCSLCSEPKTINEFTVCQSLKRLLESNRYEHRKHIKLVTAVKSIIGPGTMLHRKIEFLASKKCGCETKVMLMNEMGPLACAQDIQTILTWLKDATILSGLPFVELTIQNLVNESIEESITLYNKYNLLPILDL